MMEHDVLKISEENKNLSIPAFICKLLFYVIPRKVLNWSSEIWKMSRRQHVSW